MPYGGSDCRLDSLQSYSQAAVDTASAPSRFAGKFRRSGDGMGRRGQYLMKRPLPEPRRRRLSANVSFQFFDWDVEVGSIHHSLALELHPDAIDSRPWKVHGEV